MRKITSASASSWIFAECNPPQAGHLQRAVIALRAGHFLIEVTALRDGYLQRAVIALREGYFLGEVTALRPGYFAKNSDRI